MNSTFLEWFFWFHAAFFLSFLNDFHLWEYFFVFGSQILF
jgi:hypothetical protein